MSTNLTDHVGILTHSALGTPAKKEKKDGTIVNEYYALVAFPPSAREAFKALLGDTKGMRHTVRTNADRADPIPGIPEDWLVVRAGTQFAPSVVDANGNVLDQTDPEAVATIRATFHAGRNVRVLYRPYEWVTKESGQRGKSFNLTGIMDAGEGERMALGASAERNKITNVFASYAKTAEATPVAAPVAKSKPVAKPGNNPFIQGANASFNPEEDIPL